MNHLWIQKIFGAVQDHLDFTFDFYGLDFWKDRSLMEGYQVAVDEFVDVAEDKLTGSNQWLQAGAASTLEVARLFGALPLAVHHWWIEAAKQSDEGVWAMAYRAVEIPVQGFLHGARYVGDSARGWFHGSLNEKSSFQIASEVTGVLGAVVFMAAGAQSIASGGGKIVRGAKGAAGEVSSVAASNNLAAATASATIDGALILQGTRQAMGGPVYWMAAGGALEAAAAESPPPAKPSAGNRPKQSELWARDLKGEPKRNILAEALRVSKGDRKQAAQLTGLSRQQIADVICKAEPNSELAPYKIPRGVVSKIPAEVLVETLEAVGWWQGEAARRLGISQSTISHRFRHALPNSYLGRIYQKIKSRWETQRVSKKSEGPKKPRPPKKLRSRGKPKTKTPPRAPKAHVENENPQLIRQRLQAAPDLAPHARIVKNRVTDATLADLLDHFAYNIDVVATVLGIPPDTIRLRLQLLRDHPEWRGQSPLVPYLSLLD